MISDQEIEQLVKLAERMRSAGTTSLTVTGAEAHMHISLELAPLTRSAPDDGERKLSAADVLEAIQYASGA